MSQINCETQICSEEKIFNALRLNSCYLQYCRLHSKALHFCNLQFNTSNICNICFENLKESLFKIVNSRQTFFCFILLMYSSFACNKIRLVVRPPGFKKPLPTPELSRAYSKRETISPGFS
jgi:hypothetical protein